MKKRVYQKPVSIFRQLLLIRHEEALQRKAVRELAKADWSFEFLTLVVQKAAKLEGKNISIVVECKNGNKIRISSEQVKKSVSDDIFNKLDDDLAVQRFIREHSKR